MHLVASSRAGAVIAFVGQLVMHALQLPQLLESVLSLSGNGIFVKISPRKKKDPACSFRTNVCLPTQPSPAFAASGFSNTGAESTNAR